MKTTFRAREPYAGLLLSIARSTPCQSPARPEHFMKVMAENRGILSAINGIGLGEELERKNPLFVALGDSVTAGHFESYLMANPKKWLLDALSRTDLSPEDFDLRGALRNEKALERTRLLLAAHTPVGVGLPPVEVTDCRESYVEKFREKLIERYEETSPSAINSGIAGDTLLSMEKRLTRDVLRYDPDLILVNGSLNWGPDLGSSAYYKEILQRMVRRMKNESTADIILLTPNALVATSDRVAALKERVEAIREVAEEEKVCLCDAFAVWEKAKEEGCPFGELLANGINHPGAQGHEAYAICLMKLFS